VCASLQVQLAEQKDFSVIVDMLMPWSSGGDEGGAFTPLKPTIADLDCNITERATFFASTMMSKVVLGLIEKGSAKSKELLAFASALAAGLEENRPDELPEACAQIADYGSVVAEALLLLSDPDPLRVEECTRMTSVRKMLMSEDVGHPWELFGMALDGERKYWEPLKTAFQKNRMWDLEHAPAVRAALKSFKDTGATTETLKIGVQLLGQLSSKCRPGGLKRLENAVDTGLAYLADQLADGSSEQSPEYARAVAELLSQARRCAHQADKQRSDKLSEASEKAGAALSSIMSTTSSIAILKALDIYAKQNNSDNFSEVRAAYDSAKGLVFSEPAHVSTIIEGVRAIVRQSLSSLSQVNNHYLASCATLSDLCIMGSYVASMVSEPSVELKGLMALLWCGKAHVTVLEASASFKALGDTGAMRWEADEGHDYWAKLHASLVELDLKEWLKEWPDDATTEADWENLESGFQAHVELAKSMDAEYVTDSVDDALEKLRKALELLQAINGGMSDGSSWKAGLPEGPDYAQVVQWANSTIWGKDQKGLPKKLNAAMASVAASLKATENSLEKVCEKGNEQFVDVAGQCAQAMLLSDVTVIEAKLMQNISRDTRTPLVTRVAAVQSEVDRLHDSPQLRPDMLEPSLWAKALSFIRE